MIAAELFEKKRCDGCNKKGGAHRKGCSSLHAVTHAASLVSRAARSTGPKTVSEIVTHLGLSLAKKLGMAKDMVYSEHADAPKEQQPAWLGDHGKEYDEFTRHFLTPRQLIFHLANDKAKGAEQFGAHVVSSIERTPSGDGTTPAEKG